MEILGIMRIKNGPQLCFSSLRNSSYNPYEIQNPRAERSRAELYLQHGGGVGRERDLEKHVYNIFNQVVAMFSHLRDKEIRPVTTAHFFYRIFEPLFARYLCSELRTFEQPQNKSVQIYI